MQVFEFHFNPKLKSDLLFDSFCYEPENLYEKRIGNLYLVGILKNALPQNARFLDNLAKTIKGKYYRFTLKNPEKALKEALKEANEFLEQIVKRGDVRWLGNLSFAILSLKNYELNFTKVGDLKIFLLRNGRVTDIDRKLKFDDIAPWPLRVFGNIVSGKLTDGDVLLISTKEVTNFFEKENLLPEIAKIDPVSENKFKELFDRKQEEILKISGLCLVIVLTKELLRGKKEVISPKSYPKEFNFKVIFDPFLAHFKKIVKKPALPKLKLGKIKLIKPEFLIPKIKLPRLNKNLITISALIFFLLLGTLLAQREERQKIKEYQTTLNEVREKIIQAESFLILKESKPQAANNMNSLLKAGWEDLSLLVKAANALPSSFAEEIYALRDRISTNLYQLNKLKIIEEPELFFEFDQKDFIPQKIAALSENLYFFSPFAQNLFELGKDGKEGKTIPQEQKFNLAANLDNSLAFYSKPNQVFVFKDGSFSQVSLEEPYVDFNFDDFSSFKGNLYFLDKKEGEIIRYPYLGEFNWGNPEIWLKNKTPDQKFGGRGISVDGAVWVLNKDNSVSRFHAGNLQETIKLNVFPEVKNFSKILTSPILSNLYLLEPGQNRLVILNKSGEIVQQLQSQEFDNLLDFSVSQDGKTIYLLNGLKVYQVLF